MKILVTGGAGFIGSAVVRAAVGRGHGVVNVDALTYAACLDNVAEVEGSPLYAFEHADIRDAGRHGAGVRRARARRGDASRRRKPCRPLDRRPRRLHRHQHRRHRDAAAGGAGVLGGRRPPRGVPLPPHLDRRGLWLARPGRGGGGKFTEATPYDPRSPYSASKAASDHLVRAWGETYGLPVLVTNCSNNYGPYHFPEKLIPVVILNALAGREIPVYGAGLNVRDWLYVEDHADALLTVLERGAVGRTYNIGGENEARNIDLVRTICRLLDDRRPEGAPHERLIRFVTDRPGHDLRYAIDPSRIRGELGWRPSVTLEQGLARTVDWYLAREDWWQPLLERDGVGRRLGRGMKE